MNKVLLNSALAVLLLAGCTEEKKPTAEVTVKAETQKVETVKPEAKEAPVEVAKIDASETKEIASKTEETANKIVEKTVEEVKEPVEEVVKIVEPIVANTSTKVEEAEEATKEIAVTVVEQTKETVSSVANEAKEMINTEVEAKTEKVEEAIAEPVAIVEGLDGEMLYKSCASCHGLKAEKQALGKSQIIAGWAKEKTIQALNGYKDGSYGGVMKNIMKGQVATKTDLEIEALAVFISKL